jgi:signal transduction histidine kinase
MRCLENRPSMIGMCYKFVITLLGGSSMIRKSLFGLIALFCLLAFGLMAWAGEEGFKYQQTKDLKALVDKAAGLVSQKGEAAFSQFKQKGSPWLQGDRYVFVFTLDGVLVCDPVQPGAVGKSQMHLKDAWGKQIFQRFISEVTRVPGRPYGWTHYLWPKPGQKKPSWKTTYLRLAQAPSGKKYIVASGLYDMKMEPAFAKDEVEEAVRLIKQKGKAAFKELRDKSSEFIFQDTFVWVASAKGVELVNPAFPKLEGSNLWDKKDGKGRYTVREEVALVKSKGQGWIEGQWARAGQTKLSNTLSYVMGVKVKGELLIVGCSLYLD